MQSIKLILAGLLSLVVMQGKAQTAVTGKIISALDKRPVENMSITNQSNGTGTVSGEDGEFSILLITGMNKLSFRKVGGFELDTLIEFPLAKPLLISMQNQANQLEEITVNTGYQQIPKERATGSFYQLKNKVIELRVGPDILSRIESAIPGVYFDKRDVSSPKIQIRGISTLTNTILDPLIVLDNFPYEGSINSINPNDVENITVLKDAAASSIWGARAGNGVIVITTKKGRFNKPLSIDLNSNITFKPVTNIYNKYEMSVGSTIEVERYLFEKGAYDYLFTDPFMQPLPQVAEILNQIRTGAITPSVGEQRISDLAKYDIRDDLTKYVYRKSLNQQYSLSLNGGSEFVKYIFSAGYDNIVGDQVGNSTNRITLRSDNTFKIGKKIQATAGMIYTNTKGMNNAILGYGQYYNTTAGAMGYTRLADENGNPLAIDFLLRGNFTDTVGMGKFLDWKYRPLEELKNNDDTNSLSDILLNLSGNYKPLNWLNFDLKYQYQNSGNLIEKNNNVNSYFTRDYVNRYSQIVNNQVKYIIPLGGILQRTDGRMISQSLRGQVNIDRRFADDHELHVIAGAEVREKNLNSLAQNIYGYDENTLSISPVDFNNLYPIFAGLDNNSYVPSGLAMGHTVNRFFSVYGNGAYTYKNRYTISASARRDASNLFGVSTNQKWQPLYSIGGSWLITNEKFVSVDWLSKLSARITYGLSGNIDPNATALTRISYVVPALNTTNIPAVSISAPPNPNLRWEKVETMNFALDFSFLQDRIGGSIEYYVKNSTDLFNTVRFDKTSGIQTARQNSASLSGKGVDINISSRNLVGLFSWTSNFFLSQVSTKITKNLNPPSLIGFTSNGNSIYPIEGYNPYMVVSYKWAGLDPIDGSPRGILNGVVTKDYAALFRNSIEEQVVHGSAVPTVYGALRNNFEYKSFSLSFNLSYKLGYYFRRPALNYTQLFQNGKGLSEYEQRWRKPGDEMNTSVPSLIYPANSQRDVFYERSEINVEKGDHIRFEEINLGYRFSPRPGNFFKAIHFYAFANNLNWVIWKANRAGLDPNIIYGIRYGANFSAGIKFTL
ncbi:MAG: SusC/RagA family TonB-linked outer membrane protein [Chryseobacterium sp.]|nr:MAG: SusC/RagA family TonB-linked outer membrane protein [Chryseobacterium sp.]